MASVRAEIMMEEYLRLQALSDKEGRELVEKFFSRRSSTLLTRENLFCQGICHSFIASTPHGKSPGPGLGWYL